MAKAEFTLTLLVLEVQLFVGIRTLTCVIPATASPGHMEDDLKAGFGRLPDAQQRELIRRLWASL